MRELSSPPSGDDPGDPAAPEQPRSLRLGKVTLECETCDQVTSHRILRLARSGRTPRAYSGVAKCAVCQSTHPFRLAARPQRTVGVRVVVSDGPRSIVERIEMAPGQSVREGMRIDLAGGGASVRRIEPRGVRVPRPIPAEAVETLWAIRESALRIPVSLVEGARTRGVRAPITPDVEFEVGTPFLFEGVRYRIHAIRSRGRNHESAGRRFRGSEIQRLYVHREGEPQPRSAGPRRFFGPGGSRFGPRAEGRGFRRPGRRGPPRYPRRSARIPPAGNSA